MIHVEENSDEPERIPTRDENGELDIEMQWLMSEDGTIYEVPVWKEEDE